MNDLYDNTLCQDLFSNSPQTVRVELPADLGTGTLKQAATRQNVTFSEWEMTCCSPVVSEGTCGPDFLQVLFCLDHGITWQAQGRPEEFRLERGESCIFRGRGRPERACYGENVHFHLISIRIPVACFDRLLKTFFQDSEIRAYEQRVYEKASVVTITPRMEQIFSELREFPRFRGGLGSLYLESKLAELLCVWLSALLEMDILISPAMGIPKSDRERMEDARKILDSELAFAPTAEQLAQRLGLSVSRLSRGFASLYGMPIHAYVIDQRLKRAAVLLLESSLTVTQISELVGYSKPSNFAAAFKRKYGVSPKDYKRSITCAG